MRIILFACLLSLIPSVILAKSAQAATQKKRSKKQTKTPQGLWERVFKEIKHLKEKIKAPTKTNHRLHHELALLRLMIAKLIYQNQKSNKKMKTLEKTILSLQDSIGRLRKKLQLFHKRMGGKFSCIPPRWGYNVGKSSRYICRKKITLPYDAVVIASFTGHWKVKSDCYAFVDFDDDTKNTQVSDSKRFAPGHTHGAHWRSVSSTRTKILKKGRHIVSYRISTKGGNCSMNGSSLHGMYFALHSMRK